MTIDEAIIMHKQKADNYHKAMPNYGEAADHRQLAEWLTELNDSRAVQNEQEIFIHELMGELEEAKRLLKAAVEDLSCGGENNKCTKSCKTCTYNSIKGYGCRYFGEYHWRYEAEALALIGEGTNVPASADDTNVGHKSGDWISCKDRMPEVNEPVLFIFNTESGFKAVMYGWHETIKGLGSGWHQAGVGGARADEEVTYWQPLPEPPKDGEQNG